MSADAQPQAFIVHTETAESIHARADCPGLSRATAVEPTTYADAPERRRCPVCHETDRHITTTPAVPAEVACPCGDGHAEAVASYSEPRGHRRVTMHNYRHRGCPLGGTIVVAHGRRVRSCGPLFHPDRYGVDA